MYLAQPSRKPPVRLRHPRESQGTSLTSSQPIEPRQLRRLQALWRRWSGSLGLLPEADRQLRYYYIERITEGRAGKTLDLDETTAEQVIQWLRERLRRSEAAQNYAAGTAGRRGYPDPQVPPTLDAWSALWGVARSLGMDRPSLERFIRRHYSGIGLQGLSDLRTMADLNRVLWGLKAVARRSRREAIRDASRPFSGSSHARKRAA